MRTHPALVHLHLLEYAPRGDHPETDLLAQIAARFDPDLLSITVAPQAGPETDLQNHPETLQLVLYERGETAVRAAMLAGTPPGTALADWEADMLALLGFCRRHRRGVLLAERGAVYHQPEDFAAALMTHLDLELPKSTPLQGTTSIPAPLESIIAAQTVAQSLSARALNGELEASALPLAAANTQSCDPDAGFEVIRIGQQAARDAADHHQTKAATQDTEIAKLQAQLQTQNNSADIIRGDFQQELARVQKLQAARAAEATAQARTHLNQIEALQQEVAAYFQEAKQLDEGRAALEEQITTLERAAITAAQLAEKQTSDLRDGVHYLQTVEADLGRTKDNLKHREQALQDAQNHATELARQLAEREEHLQQVLHSTSWRVTGALRRTKDRLTKPKN